MMNQLKLCVVSLIVIFLSACAASMDAADAYKGESDAHIFRKGQAALVSSDYAEAVKRFEALDVQYPFGLYTERSQLFLIYAYYMKEDYALAVAAATHFIRLHPTNPHVDYAYFMRGVSNYYQNMGVIERIFSIDLATRDLTQINKAYSDFNTIVQTFPSSRYAGPAHQYLIYLRNVLADHDLHIAEYYYNRRAYIAAINRAGMVVNKFQGAPAVKTALIIMAKAYHRLGLEKEKQDVLAIIELNFPGTMINYNSMF